MAPVLASYNYRGLCEPILYLIRYKGVKFEDKRYAGVHDWTTEKFNMNLDFPNLPYYIDGKLRITQSLAILRYLARKHNLAGSSEEEQIQLEIVEQQLLDLRANYVRICNKPDIETIKQEFIMHLPAQFERWSTYLGEKKFLAGDKLTYVDFLAYDIFDLHGYLLPTLFSNNPNLEEYQKRFRSIPELQPYLTSKEYIAASHYGLKTTNCWHLIQNRSLPDEKVTILQLT